MTDPTPNRPLWRAVLASRPAGDHMPGVTIAAELRAIADWLVPEEEPGPLFLEDQIAWVTRYNLRQKLFAEANRAEAGE